VRPYRDINHRPLAGARSLAASPPLLDVLLRLARTELRCLASRLPLIDALQPGRKVPLAYKNWKRDQTTALLVMVVLSAFSSVRKKKLYSTTWASLSASRPLLLLLRRVLVRHKQEIRYYLLIRSNGMVHRLSINFFSAVRPFFIIWY
jgi:hypothetical protein